MWGASETVIRCGSDIQTGAWGVKTFEEAVALILLPTSFKHFIFDSLISESCNNVGNEFKVG